MYQNQTVGQLVPGLLAVVIVIGWIIGTIVGVGDTPELHDGALIVLGFYFGGTVHSAGVTSGAAAAVAALPH